MNQPEGTSLSNPAFLAKIDQLREHNIGQHVPLPQLVVVGDQSSGKSSLLESLTGIPFPRNVELCTRHATQITSRRDPQSRVEIRIIPGPQASETHKKSLEAYIHNMPSNKELHTRFSDVLKDANLHMGMRTDMSSKTGTIFSEDVLKIEVYGPKEEYLTIIDVPGIFRNHVEGITTREDITLVNSLVKKYIKDRRTIILAVLPSNVDIATQEIIALAEECDVKGERTLGVLTKPDLVTESSAKMSVCNLVSGKRRPLSLGYYVVRNRGADDENNVEHEALEKLFEKEPWSSLPRERVGINALKKQLETLLAQITRREFPNLHREISSKLAKCEKDLNDLGPARPTEKGQRAYLGTIARHFEELTRGAMNAQYSHHKLFEKYETRLITCLVNLAGVFRDNFELYGQLRHFKDIEPVKRSTGPSSEETFSDDDDSLCFTQSPVEFHRRLRKSLGDWGRSNLEKYPELGGIVAEGVEVEEPEDGIMDWIKKLYLQSRGMDLGTFSPDLLSAAFGEQSRQWEPMVRVYMGEVVRLIHHFINEALRAVCTDDDIAKEILSVIIDPVLERYKSGLDQALLLVDVERHQRPFTMNRSFNEEVQVARGRRMREMLRPKAWKNAQQYGDEKKVINLDEVARSTSAKPNEQYLEEEIHDKLQSYYQLAVDRFMDNIFRQAVGHHLLTGPESPLAVFSQRWVIDLDAETLELIAGEKEAVKRRREILTKKRKDLRGALNILKP